MNKLIALDIDVTTAGSDKSWYHWLCSVTGTRLATKPWEMQQANYDLTVYFKDELQEQGITGMEFWKQEGLYGRFMEPVEGCVEALERISSLGYTIVPVSKEMGLHGYSKRQWVKKHLSMCEPCILVDGEDPRSVKSYVKADYVIDDRASELASFQSPTEGIIYNTSYLDLHNISKIKIPYVVMDRWDQIVDYLEEEIKI